MMRSLALLGAVVLATSTPAAADHCDGATAVATVRELCAAVAAGPDAAVKARVRWPLRVRRIVSEGAGTPRFRDRRLGTVRAVRAAGLCDGATLADATVAAEDATQLVTAPRGQFAVTFTLVRRGHGCAVFRVDDH